MYQHIIDALNETINYHRSKESPVAIENRDLHYFIQGLQVAKQIVSGCEDSAIDDTPHETFEDTVRALWNELDRNEMLTILDDISVEMEEK